jgi:hypothetical protein
LLSFALLAAHHLLAVLLGIAARQQDGMGAAGALQMLCLGGLSRTWMQVDIEYRTIPRRFRYAQAA